MPSVVGNDQYGVYPTDGTTFQLSPDPLDDYQRYLFVEVYELMRPSLAQFPHALKSQLSIDRKEYKTNTVFESFESQSSGDINEEGSHTLGQENNGKYTNERRQNHRNKSGSLGKLKKSTSLICNEYIIPDISRNPVTQRTFDPHFQPYLQLTPYNILSLEDEQEDTDPNQPCFPDDLSSSDRELRTAINLSNKPGSNITKNQEFRMIKLNAKINQTLIINPNNCIIWNCETGYVFFTGIWRLYQDIMKCLCTTNRQYQQDQSARIHCCKELQKVLFQVIYGKLDKPSKKDSQQKWNKWFQRESFSTYIDLHWHKLNPTLSTLLGQSYDAKIPFEHMVKRIRGGYIKIQGTWLPYPVSKELCSRFCYPLRYLLVPLFGPDFPEKCEYWYSQRTEISPSLTASISPKSTNSISTLTSDERDSLNTAQDLLNISRRSSWNEYRHPSIVPQIHLQNRHYRSQSWTGIVQQNPAAEERRKSSDVTLPPIQYLFDDIRNSYLDDPKR